MTKRERAQVVELLRCGADVYRAHGRDEADSFVKTIKKHLARKCFEAEWAVVEEIDLDFYRCDDDHCDVLLEAAARVEEGEYP